MELPSWEVAISPNLGAERAPVRAGFPTFSSGPAGRPAGGGPFPRVGMLSGPEGPLVPLPTPPHLVGLIRINW
jgi:hypothetical protein